MKWDFTEDNKYNFGPIKGYKHELKFQEIWRKYRVGKSRFIVMSMGRDMQVDYCNRFINSKLCHNGRVKLLLPHPYIDWESIRNKNGSWRENEITKNRLVNEQGKTLKILLFDKWNDKKHGWRKERSNQRCRRMKTSRGKQFHSSQSRKELSKGKSGSAKRHRRDQEREVKKKPEDFTITSYIRRNFQ